MKQTLTKINREKGFSYRIDKEGNVIKESYNWFRDPYTLVAIVIIVLGSLYYLQISSMKTTEKNFEETCLTYVELRNKWMKENPGRIPTLEEVFSIKKDDYSNKNIQIPK